MPIRFASVSVLGCALGFFALTACVGPGVPRAACKADPTLAAYPGYDACPAGLELVIRASARIRELVRVCRLDAIIPE